MSIHKIIIYALISGVLVFFFVSLTFFSSHKAVDQQDLAHIQHPLSILQAQGKTFHLSPIEKFSNKESIYVKNLQDLNNVFSTEVTDGDFSVDEKGNAVTYSVKSGLFLFDINNIAKTYTITGNGFELNVISPGRIYVDTSSPDKTRIFSFDSLFELKLVDPSTHAQMTQMLMYPHMYVGFPSNRISYFKNTNLSRLEQLAQVLYLSRVIDVSNNTISKEFLDMLYKSDSTPKPKQFLQTVISYLYGSEETKKYTIKNLTFLKQNELTGLDYIEKYFFLFFNKEKKVIYYKKQLFAELNKFFTLMNDPELKTSTLNIENLLDEIEQLDETSYQDSVQMISVYFNYLYHVNDIRYTQNAIALSKIIHQLNKVLVPRTFESAFYLNKIYQLIDSGNFDYGLLQTHLLTFINRVLQMQGVTVNGDNYDFEIDTTRNSTELESLAFFLRNILLYDISFSNQEHFHEVVDIMNVYYSLQMSLLKDGKGQNAQGLIIEFSSIIQKTLKNLSTSFFLPDRGTRKLLILKPNVSLNKQEIDYLNSSVQLFFQFYTKRKDSLSVRNQVYNSLYDKNKAEFDELFLALGNYNEYQLKYDPLKGSLFGIATITEETEKIKLSEGALTTYLSKFSGIDSNSIRAKIVDNEYYQMSNISIQGHVYSFDLYPLEGNMLKKIYIDGEFKRGSYNLDEIQAGLEERLKTAKEEEKEKYDFKNFFSNTFFPKDSTEITVFQAEDDVEHGDSTIAAFKKDRLFGKKGEFNIISGFLKIGFNSVDVEFSNDSYQIFVKKASFAFTSSDDQGEFAGYFDGEYVFTNKDHYFKNIKLTFCEPMEFKLGKCSPLFSGKQFEINENINIVDLEQRLKTLIPGYF